MNTIKCEHKSCADQDIHGRCNTCKKFNYLCANHLSIHLKKKHKIVQLGPEEIMIWKKSKIDQEKYFKKREFLKKIKEAKSKIISNSFKIIQAIEQFTENALSIINKQIASNENFNIDEIDIPEINTHNMNLILNNPNFLFNVKMKVTDHIVDYGNIFETTKVNELYMNNQARVNVTVWKATVYQTGKAIALKECISIDLESLKNYSKEANILNVLSGKSDNFLKFYGSTLKCIGKGKNLKYVYTTQMEYVETTLIDYKHQRDSSNKPYNEYEIHSIYNQLIVAFNIMRAIGILHRDIKPRNILITDDLVIKIIDFSVAKIGIGERTKKIRPIGTVQFMSPEMRKCFDSKTPVLLIEDKSDVFSLGLTILSLVTNRLIDDLNLKKNEPLLIHTIRSIRYEWLKPILHRMLVFDQSIRCGFKDLIETLPPEYTLPS